MVKNSIFITTSNIGYGTGGGAVCYNICQVMKKTTNLIDVIATCDYFPSDLKVSCKCSRPDCYKQKDNPFLYDYFAYWNLPDEHIDICHMYGSPFGITAREIKRRNPRSIILMDIPAHDLELSIDEHMRIMGHYPFFHMTDDFLWKIFCEHVSQADIIIAPSKLSIKYIQESETFKKLLGFQQDKVPKILIPHGTVLPKLEDVQPFPENFNVATVSVPGPDKGQIYLLTAWKMLENIFPESFGYTCTVAGWNTQNWQPFVDKEKIKNVKLGAVKNVADVYNNCSVYVHPSVSEGFGLTVLEAMSYCRPVIVSEGTGAVDLVEDGKNGFIIPIRSPETIIDKIRWIHDNPDEAKKMGQAARKTAEGYSWDLIQKKYEVLYEKL